MRPLAERSTAELDMLTQTCGYVISLGRMSRELDKRNGDAPGRKTGPAQILRRCERRRQVAEFYRALGLNLFEVDEPGHPHMVDGIGRSAAFLFF